MSAGGKSDAQHERRQPTLGARGWHVGALHFFPGVQLLLTPRGCKILLCCVLWELLCPTVALTNVQIVL